MVDLALGFEHDVGGVLEWREEGCGGFEETIGSNDPDIVSSTRVGIVLEHGGTVEEDADIVRPLVVVDAGTLVRYQSYSQWPEGTYVDEFVASIVHVVHFVDQPDTGSPVPDLVSPVEISLVAGESSKSSRDLEEATIGD